MENVSFVTVQLGHLIFTFEGFQADNTHVGQLLRLRELLPLK